MGVNRQHCAEVLRGSLQTVYLCYLAALPELASGAVSSVMQRYCFCFQLFLCASSQGFAPCCSAQSRLAQQWCKKWQRSLGFLGHPCKKAFFGHNCFFFPKLPFTKCWVSALLSSGPLRCRSCVPQINSPFLISCLYTVGELSAISVPAVLSVGNKVGARMGVGCKSLLSLGRASFLWSEGMLQCTGGGSGWGAGRRLIGWA